MEMLSKSIGDWVVENKIVELHCRLRTGEGGKAESTERRSLGHTINTNNLTLGLSAPNDTDFFRGWKLRRPRRPSHFEELQAGGSVVFSTIDE
jgi:hypothetical protein